MSKLIRNKPFTLDSIVHSVNTVSFNLVTHGGLLLSFFLVFLYNSFYPVESFIFPYLLAYYLNPLFASVYPQICSNTVVFTSVLVSMILYLQDPSIPVDKKKILGVSFEGTKSKNSVMVFFLLFLVLHVKDAMWNDKKSFSQLLISIIIGGFAGYSGFSVCRSREEKSAMVWFLARFVLAIVLLFLLGSYTWNLLKMNSSQKRKSVK